MNSDTVHDISYTEAVAKATPHAERGHRARSINQPEHTPPPDGFIRQRETFSADLQALRKNDTNRPPALPTFPDSMANIPRFTRLRTLCRGPSDARESHTAGFPLVPGPVRLRRTTDQTPETDRGSTEAAEARRYSASPTPLSNAVTDFTQWSAEPTAHKFFSVPAQLPPTFLIRAIYSSTCLRFIRLERELVRRRRGAEPSVLVLLRRPPQQISRRTGPNSPKAWPMDPDKPGDSRELGSHLRRRQRQT